MLSSGLLSSSFESFDAPIDTLMRFVAWKTLEIKKNLQGQTNRLLLRQNYDVLGVASLEKQGLIKRVLFFKCSIEHVSTDCCQRLFFIEFQKAADVYQRVNDRRKIIFTRVDHCACRTEKTDQVKTR